MLLHVRNILSKGESPHWVRTLDAGPLMRGQSGIAGWGPLHADLRATVAAGAIEVRGRLDIELELVCSRCLGHVKQKLEIPFREVFATRSSAEASEEGEDDLIHPVTEDKIDLTPYVEENVLLALPFVPLCSEDCKGLCPECGQNRNIRECGCRREKLDPRLAGLADFFRNTK